MENNFLEKRKHKRYFATDDVIIVCHNHIGRVINISESGIAIKFIDCTEDSTNEFKGDFLCNTTNPDIEKLPLELVRKEDDKLSPFGGFVTKTLGFTFKKLNAIQQKQVINYISGLSRHNLTNSETENIADLT